MVIGKPGARKGKRYPPEPLTTDECLRLLKACSRRSSSGLRAAAIIVLAWRGGLRVSEILALRVKDLDLDAGTARVLHGKGDKSRTVGLDPQALAIVGRWLDRRRELGIGNGQRPLICTLKGTPVSGQYVRAMLARLGKRAGIERPIRPHGLRHSHAVELVREGIPVNVIQQQLGHASLAVTDRYLRHVAPQAVVDAMRARPWPGEQTPSKGERITGRIGQPESERREPVE